MTSQQREQTELFDPLQCDALELIEHLGDDDIDQRNWPRRLHQLYEVMRAFNLKSGMAAAVAATDARDRCILMGEYLGGRVFNLPRGDALRIAVRDKQIYAEFRGANHEALATKYGLDISHLYRILRQQRRLYRSKMQGRLFDDPKARSAG